MPPRRWTKDIEPDARIIAASNEKLWEAARRGNTGRPVSPFQWIQFWSTAFTRTASKDILLFAKSVFKDHNREPEKQVKVLRPVEGYL